MSCPKSTFFPAHQVRQKDVIAHLMLVDSSLDGRKFSVNHQRLISCNLRIAGDRLGCFYSFCCCLLTGVEFQSLSLTLDGEFTSLIRNATSSEINCNAGNIRLIDNTVNISLEKAPERCVPHLIEILCSSANLTASLFQWSKSIYIFQPRVMSGSFS